MIARYHATAARVRLVTAGAAALLAVLAGSARGQLGGSATELAARFGAPVRHNARIHQHQVLDGAVTGDLYARNGLWVRAIFYEGHVNQLEFSKQQGALSPGEVQTLLAANTGGSKWEPGKDGPDGERLYRRMDGRAVASWTTDAEGSLIIAAEPALDVFRKLL